MKTTSLGPILTVTGALVAMVPMTGKAQDSFREYGPSRSSGGFGPVSPGDYTYQDVSPSGLHTLDENQAAEKEHANNIAIGPVRLSLAAGIGVEFNDNITLSDHHRESDIIIRPLASVDAIWRISE